MTRSSWVLLGLLLVATPVAAADITACASGCDHTTIQAAANAASCGDRVLLNANELYTANNVFTDKNCGTNYVHITSNASAANLPAAGHRANPSYITYMPRLKSTGGGSPAVTFAAGADGWKFSHLYFEHVPDGYSDIFRIGEATEKLLADLPDHIVIDRCVFRGDLIDGQKTAIKSNGKTTTITNNYCDRVGTVGADAQCIAGKNATGPVVIHNNYLAAAGENLIYGGSDPSLTWRMGTTGNVSTTGASVLLNDATGRTLLDLEVGDLLAIDVDPDAGDITLEFPTIATITNRDADSMDVTWTPALSANPDNETTSIRHDVVVDDLTITSNYLEKDLSWRNPLLTTPANVSAALSAGGSRSGARYCKVFAYATGSEANTIRSTGSTEVNATAGGGNGTITIDWDDATGEDSYRVYCGSSAGAENEYVATAQNVSILVDNGGLSWTSLAMPTGIGSKFQVKTLFELKVGSNFLIAGNIAVGGWEDSVSGARQGGGWFKSENQNDNGGCWTCTTREGVMRHNIFRKVHGAWSFQGRYSVNGSPTVPPAPMINVNVHDNLVTDCNDDWAEDAGETTHQILVQNGVQNITINHNTLICEDSQATMAIDTPIDNTPGFIFTNNMILRGTYGVTSDVAEGTTSLEAYAPGYTFAGNAIGGAQSGQFSTGYPSGNYYPTVTDWRAAFTNYSAAGDPLDYVIAPAHAYKNAGTDGEDIGADIAAIIAATATAESGEPDENPPGDGPGAPRRIRHR